MSISTGVKAAIIVGCGLVLVGCQNDKFEQDFFFHHPAASRLQRMRQLPLDDQYRLFRYGNDKIEPPQLGLADPIAERGEAAVPFLISKLGPNADDLTIRDVLLVFETMSSTRAYDVKSNSDLMRTLRARVSTMKDAEWKEICSRTLRRIEAE